MKGIDKYNYDYMYDEMDETSVRSVSPQHFVDCAVGEYYGNHGCNGGLPESAFTYAIDHGFSYESNYAYIAESNNCTKELGLQIISITAIIILCYLFYRNTNISRAK